MLRQLPNGRSYPIRLFETPPFLPPIGEQFPGRSVLSALPCILCREAERSIPGLRNFIFLSLRQGGEEVNLDFSWNLRST